MKTALALIDRCLLMAGLAAAVLAGAGPVHIAATEEGKVVFADDFETPSAQNPPANWAMWGAQQYKVPTNYTRDTAQRHGGHASFRIYHPARTRGYIVSSPDRAIQPRRGMIYTVSFWCGHRQTARPFSSGRRTTVSTPSWMRLRRARCRATLTASGGPIPARSVRDSTSSRTKAGSYF